MASNIESETRCHDCNTNYVDNSALKIHLQLEHGQSFDEENRNELANQQEQTNYVEEQNDTNQRNIGTVHEGNNPFRPFHCNICSTSFTSKMNLEDHLRNVHRIINIDEHLIKYKYKRYNCHQCDKELKNTKTLRKHISEMHDKKPCAQCGKLYGATAMTRHIASAHIPRNQSKFKCEVCGKGFVSTQSLKNHNNIHTGEKPYKCELCDACFASRGAQFSHLDSVHNPEKQICRQCGKEFNKHSLIKHMRTVHKIDKPFKCNICNDIFKTHILLKEHMKMKHEGSKADTNQAPDDITQSEIAQIIADDCSDESQ